MRIIATVVTDVLVLVSCHCDNAADIYGLLWDWKPLQSTGTSLFLLFTEGFPISHATAKALLTTHNGGLYTAYTFGNNMNESLNLQPNQNEFTLNHSVYMTDGIKHAGVELQGNAQISVLD
ncbi:Hypothetical predicted protein [Mytilus galloprovincialis]|uniref:Laminin G domain-containing protein n=1 Tax=Mytilus galloprovincialis TaxID=29158 RepID=A0A8B6GNY6_MYTGA|nr:Hypothetical predicted protein [Mytilus galloprovincialis]